MFIEQHIINELRTLRSAKATNSKGNVIYKKAFLLGCNEAKLISVTAKRTERGAPMFTMSYTRHKAVVNDVDVDFAPIDHIFFYPSEAFNAVLSVFDVKVQLEGESGLNAVYAELKRHIGEKVNLWVRYVEILSRDRYGRVEVTGRGATNMPILSYRQEVVGIGGVDYDWSTALVKISGKDLDDYNHVVNS